MLAESPHSGARKKVTSKLFAVSFGRLASGCFWLTKVRPSITCHAVSLHRPPNGPPTPDSTRCRSHGCRSHGWPTPRASRSRCVASRRPPTGTPPVRGLRPKRRLVGPESDRRRSEVSRPGERHEDSSAAQSVPSCVLVPSSRARSPVRSFCFSCSDMFNTTILYSNPIMLKAVNTTRSMEVLNWITVTVLEHGKPWCKNC